MFSGFMFYVLFYNLFCSPMIVFNLYNKEYILTDIICVYFQYINGFVLHMLFYITCFSQF